jgi:enoyl-[acyl-carrier protein] reductase II
MFEGDLEKGELEIGQVASLINEILPVETIMKNMIQEYNEAKERMNKLEI